MINEKSIRNYICYKEKSHKQTLDYNSFLTFHSVLKAVYLSVGYHNFVNSDIVI